MRTGSVVLTARAPRVILAFSHLDQFDRVLEWFGRVWGGAYMLCMPASNPVDPVFQRLAKAYDPDLVLPWWPTLGSIALADIDAARELVAAKRLAASEEHSVLRELGDDDALRASSLVVGPNVDHDALEALTTDLPTFSSTDVALHASHLQAELPAPLTALVDLSKMPSPAQGLPPALAPVTTPNEALSRAAADIDLREQPEWIRALLKIRFAVVGLGDDEPRGLRPDSETVYRYGAGSDVSTAVTVGLTGRAISAPGDPAWCSEAVLTNTPLNRSRNGLVSLSYQRIHPRRFLVVVGDSVADRCLYLCWLRIYGDGSSIWLPGDAATSAPDDAVALAMEHVREAVADLPGQTYNGGSISSFSVSKPLLADLQVRLATPHWAPFVTERIKAMSILEPSALPIDDPPAMFPVLPDVFDRALPIMFDDAGEAASPLRSPVPHFMSRSARNVVADLQGNWVVDAVVDRCPLPARPRATPVTTADLSLVDEGLVRAGRTGTAFVAVSAAHVPDDVLVDHALTGVQLRAPDLAAAMSALLPSGWRWELSDAGRFYEGCCFMLGGLQELLRILRDPFERAVLESFQVMDRASNTGVLLKDRRRYLRYGDFRRLVGGTARVHGLEPPTTEDLRSILDNLLQRRVLTRGLILKCSRCRYAAFYPMANLTQEFGCARCMSPEQLTSTAWCNTPAHEPSWFYRLDELVFHALNENLAAPAFALDHIGAHEPSARYSWAVELYQADDRILELDFVCLKDGKVTVGEAKSNGTFTKGAKGAAEEVAKTLRGAALFSADTALFATTADEWTGGAKTVIDAGARQSPRTWVSSVAGLK